MNGRTDSAILWHRPLWVANIVVVELSLKMKEEQMQLLLEVGHYYKHTNYLYNIHLQWNLYNYYKEHLGTSNFRP